MQANEQFLKRTFYQYLPPTILSVLGGTINVMTDSLIVGNVLGEKGLVAINLCTPIYLLLCTCGSLVGSGAATLSSMEIGRGERDRGKGCYTQAVFLIAAFAVVFTIAGLALLHPIVGLLGVQSALRQMVLDYAFIIILGAAPKLFLYIPFYYLRLDGRPRFVTVTMLTMMLLNIVLDLWFLAGLNLGMTGAALAGTISSLAACLLGFFFLTRKSSGFHLQKLRLSGLRSIFRIGSPIALNNFLSAVRLVMLNAILLSAGGTAAVSFFAVANSMSELSLCVINGVPQTTSPIIGVYYGERDNQSIRFLLHRQLTTGVLLATAYASLLAIFPAQICGMFGAGQEGKIALLCLAASLPFAMLASSFVCFFNSTARIGLANLITACRILLFAAVPAWFLSLSGDPDLVWFFYPASELLTLAAAFGMIVWFARRNPHLSRFLLLDDRLEREGRVTNFSVENNVQAVCEASEKITAFCEQNSFSPKQTITISLAIEEMLTVIQQNCFKAGEIRTVDVRVFTVQGVIGIRLRSGGREFNPLSYYKSRQDSDTDGDTLGIEMIIKMAAEVHYQRTFGVNSLLILI